MSIARRPSITGRFEGTGLDDSGTYLAPTPAFGQFTAGFLEADGFDSGGLGLTAPYPPFAGGQSYEWTAVLRNDSPGDGPIGLVVDWYDGDGGSTLLQTNHRERGCWPDDGIRCHHGADWQRAERIRLVARLPGQRARRPQQSCHR